jgi:stalled ribosome rescue protein Dom34
VSSTRRALVWVDHHEARIVSSHPDTTEPDVKVLAGDVGRPHERKHDGGHRHAMTAHFADRIVEGTREYTELVVAGPSTAKDELMGHLRDRHPELVARVYVVETLDHTSDAQLAAHARELFVRVDRMHGVHVPRVQP